MGPVVAVVGILRKRVSVLHRVIIMVLRWVVVVRWVLTLMGVLVVTPILMQVLRVWLRVGVAV